MNGLFDFGSTEISRSVFGPVPVATEPVEVIQRRFADILSEGLGE
jgi:hypothetical protein